jgi:hypothetical protein
MEESNMSEVSGEYVHPLRYRSRPCEVEAMRWTGSNADAIRAWIDQPSHQYGLGVDFEGAASLWVKKAQRWVPIEVGDYVIAEPDGDGFYPCAWSIFDQRWEPAQAAHFGRNEQS